MRSVRENEYFSVSVIFPDTPTSDQNLLLGPPPSEITPWILRSHCSRSIIAFIMSLVNSAPVQLLVAKKLMGCALYVFPSGWYIKTNPLLAVSVGDWAFLNPSPWSTRPSYVIVFKFNFTYSRVAISSKINIPCFSSSGNRSMDCLRCRKNSSSNPERIVIFDKDLKLSTKFSSDMYNFYVKNFKKCV